MFPNGKHLHRVLSPVSTQTYDNSYPDISPFLSHLVGGFHLIFMYVSVLLVDVKLLGFPGAANKDDSSNDPSYHLVLGFKFRSLDLFCCDLFCGLNT